MTRPQALPEDIKSAQAAGVTTLISLLEPEEAAKIGLKDEATVCADHGITFLNHPIRDMHLPNPGAFTAFASATASRIQDGEHVALHCYASIGRSGMLVCAILAHFGFDAETALTHVSVKRGTQIPDTPAQTAFIRQIAQAPR